MGKQSGNVLFLILVGVALFAALSFTVMRSATDSAETGNDGQAKIHAAEILRYATSMRAAVDHMRGQGLSENDLSFAHPDLHTDYGVYGSNPTGEIFNPQGGGMTYLKPKAAWLDESFSSQPNYGDWALNGHNTVEHVGTDNGTNSAVDIVLFLPYLKKDVCTALGVLLGTLEEGEAPAQDTNPFDVVNRWQGVANFLSSIDNAGNESLETFCLEGSGTPPSDSYHFYQVLIAR